MFSVYKKELQSYFYSPFAYIICSLFMLIFSFSFTKDISNLSSSTYSFSFPSVFYNNFFFFIFLIPALTMKTFADERKSGTEVLLMSSPLNIPQIVFGKFLAVATVFLLMCVLTLTYPIVALIYGKVFWSSLICGYIGFFAWGLVCIALGMLMSSFTENPIIAAILGEASMLVLIFMDNLSESSLVASVPFLSNIFKWFSTQQRFTMFSQGIFSLSDLIFYITLVFVFISWTMISIQKRRWSRG